MATLNMGQAVMHLGRMEDARGWLTQSVRLYHEIGDKDGLSECFASFAILANAANDFRRAARLFGVASKLREEAGTVPTRADQLESEQAVGMTRSRLDPATFEAAWAEGQALTLDQAISFAVS